MIRTQVVQERLSRLRVRHSWARGDMWRESGRVHVLSDRPHIPNKRFGRLQVYVNSNIKRRMHAGPFHVRWRKFSYPCPSLYVLCMAAAQDLQFFTRNRSELSPQSYVGLAFVPPSSLCQRKVQPKCEDFSDSLVEVRSTVQAVSFRIIRS